MKKLGIIGAMTIEVATLKSKLEAMTVTTKAGMEFCEGKLAGLDVVVVQCGVGKVNAAMCAQILCACFGVTHLVNTGIAGSLNAALDIGDVVVGSSAMYHDFDCANFGYTPGQVPGSDVVAYPADKEMIDMAFQASDSLNPGHTLVGRIATGDQFVCRKEQKEHIIDVTQADCTEMEGGAIAQVAYTNSVPFVILRAISDKADDSAQMDYPTFERKAAEHCAAVTELLAKRMCE